MMHRIRQELAARAALANSPVMQQRFDAWRDKWKGKTAVVLASGPSLTSEDVELVRNTGWPTIVTNTTFKLAPWAAVLFFHDQPWWKVYREEVIKVFRGEIVTKSPIVEHNILCVRKVNFNVYGNSGAASISFAIHAGALRVICLGLDCKTDQNGQTHWHGSHPRGLGNAVSMPKWIPNFELLEEYAKEKKVKIINASRDTSLTCFTRASLESQF